MFIFLTLRHFSTPRFEPRESARRRSFFFSILVCPTVIKEKFTSSGVFPLPGVSEVSPPLSAFPEFLLLTASGRPVIGYEADLRVTLRSPLHGLIAAGRGFLAAGSEEFGLSWAVIDSWLVGREEEKDNKRGGGSGWQLAGGKNPLLALVFGPFVT